MHSRLRDCCLLHRRTPKVLGVLVLPLLLSACMGGTIAQQLVSSMLMHGADKATTAMIDSHEKNQQMAQRQMRLPDSPPDEYKIAFVNAAFEEVVPKVEALPATSGEESFIATQEAALVSELVQVEVWGLLAGEEKQRLLEQAWLKGSPHVPPKEQWRQWQVATGALLNSKASASTLMFLIPPEVGKIPSGKTALVELSAANDLSIARYSGD